VWTPEKGAMRLVAGKIIWFAVAPSDQDVVSPSGQDALYPATI
jgi:hypothetical protein